jgi:hypothetical protein
MFLPRASTDGVAGTMPGMAGDPGMAGLVVIVLPCLVGSHRTHARAGGRRRGVIRDLARRHALT